MAFGRHIYNALFRRTSTFALTIVIGAVLFERVFDQTLDNHYESVNQGVCMYQLSKWCQIHFICVYFLSFPLCNIYLYKNLNVCLARKAALNCRIMINLPRIGPFCAMILYTGIIYDCIKYIRRHILRRRMPVVSFPMLFLMEGGKGGCRQVHLHNSFFTDLSLSFR